jgi:hypothetical protein
MPAKRKAMRSSGKPVRPAAAPARKGRQLPRRFEFHWGGGEIVEEAAYVGRYTEPAIQLLSYDGGSYGIRFCYYSHDGRFQRSPMMIDSEDSLDGLRAALRKTPKLRAMLKKLVS